MQSVCIATRASSPRGSTKDVRILLASDAMASHRSDECDLNDVHIHFQAAVSMPEGPAEPSIRSTELRMKGLSILSKKTGSGEAH